MKKILWHSNAPWANSGYGSQTQMFVPMLADLGYELAISAFYGLGGTMQEWEGIPVYPSDDAYGNRWITGYTGHFGGGDPGEILVLTLMDVWVLDSPLWKDLNVASWVPVDHEPVPPRVRQYFERTSAIPIAMSRFGEQQLREAELDPLYVPHGVVSDLMKPRPQVEARENLGIPKDAFVVGMVAANRGTSPARKAFPQVFEAFAEFRRRHDDAFLFLHTEPKAVSASVGLDLLELAKLMGIPFDAMANTPPLLLDLGVTYQKMSWIYSCFDVLASPSYGEGFGIPIIEAQACGVPVIVSDFSAMPELVGAGWKVGGERIYDTAQGSWWFYATPAEILDALEAAYARSGDRKSADAEAARAKALEYDARTVLEAHWRPVLLEVSQRIADRKVAHARNGQMPSVRLNRRARRAATKR